MNHYQNLFLPATFRIGISLLYPELFTDISLSDVPYDLFFMEIKLASVLNGSFRCNIRYINSRTDKVLFLSHRNVIMPKQWEK